MACSRLIIFVAIFLVLQSITATRGHSSRNSSFFDHDLETLCEDIECGKGTCNASLDYDYNFICECEPGWTQLRGSDDNHTGRHHHFRPCIYPNCTMDYSCGEAPPPVPAIEELPTNRSFFRNISSFDPCSWVYCGDGSCTPTDGHGYTCDCLQGYTNLINNTAFPCFSNCVIGSDCTELGITLFNESAVSTPNSENYATSVMPTSFLWLIILIASQAMAPRF